MTRMINPSRIRKAYASKGDDATLSRFVKLTTAERLRRAAEYVERGGFGFFGKVEQ